MTNEQLAAYLEMLFSRLEGVRGRLIENLLQEGSFNCHSEYTDERKAFGILNPRLGQPLILDEFTDVMVDIRETINKLTPHVRNIGRSAISQHFAKTWAVEE